jgi:NuA3 HAT complex component NTO1
MRIKLNTRSYTSVATFSAELANVLSSDLGVEVANTAELQQQVSGRAFDMTVEQRERRKLAKRIVKAIQPLLEEALRSESEVSGRPFEKQIRELDMMLDSTILSRRGSYAGSNNDEVELRNLLKPANGHGTPLPSIRLGKGVNQHDDHEMGVFPSANSETADVQDVDMVDAPNEPGEELDGSIAQLNVELSADTQHAVAAHTPPASTNGVKGDAIHDQTNLSSNFRTSIPEPPTPPLSLEGLQQSSFATGGIPWYVEPFDPDGTTIHEERWTGPEVLREMSEELTDIDDEELLGLGGSDYDTEKPDVSNTTTTAATTVSTPVARNGNTKKNGKQRRRWKGFK